MPLGRRDAAQTIADHVAAGEAAWLPLDKHYKRRLLRDWLTQRQITRDEAAPVLGIRRSTLDAKITGRRPIRWRILTRIVLIETSICCRKLPPGWPPEHLPWAPEPNRLHRIGLRNRAKRDNVPGRA